MLTVECTESRELEARPWVAQVPRNAETRSGRSLARSAHPVKPALSGRKAANSKRTAGNNTRASNHSDPLSPFPP